MGKFNKICEDYGYLTKDSIDYCAKKKYTFYDDDGYFYFTTPDKIKTASKKGGRISRFGNGNIYTIKNINTFLIEKNSKIKVLDDSKYKNNLSKLSCYCSKHGYFVSSWAKIQQQTGDGCTLCGREINKNSIKKDFEDVLLSFKFVHGNKYDYSKSKYNKSSEKICIICPIHGEFWQTPANHSRGQGCPFCSRENSKGSRFEKQEIIKDFNKIHKNKYTYNDFNFENLYQKINIMCPIHGIFTQSIRNHRRGDGCPKCGGRFTRTKKEFLNIANNVHDFYYDYSKTVYKNAHTDIIIGCPIHGNFKQSPNNHIRGQGCPRCATKSKGEDSVRKFLIENGIEFIEQFRYDKCRFKRRLPFDFKIKNQNILIEYDGIQHYSSSYWGGEKGFKERKIRDNIKTEFCKDNDIKLIRIPYWDFDKIEDILTHEIIL